MTAARKIERRRARMVRLLDRRPRGEAEAIAKASTLMQLLIDEAGEEAARDAVQEAIEEGKVIPRDRCYGGLPQPERLDELLEAIAAGDAVRATDILLDEWPHARPLHVSRQILADRNHS